MDIMYALYKHWTDMILSGEKPLEFRTKLPKDMKPGTKILLYETRKHNGAGAVVGECTVKDIIPIKNGTRWPLVGCYPFLDWYCEHIRNDVALANHIRAIRSEFDNMAGYRYGFVSRYIFSTRTLEQLRLTGRPFDLMQMTIDERDEILKEYEKANDLEYECDDWLTKIGLYNEFGETNYQYALVLDNPVRYQVPKQLNEFKGTNGKPIGNAPQSYCYATL